MKKKGLKPIPTLKSEDAEHEFWGKADLTDYLDFSKFHRVRFPNLKFPTETISIRFPKLVLDELKAFANKHDVAYQGLIKLWVAERLSEERKRTGIL
jgi:predicted DNA binding CopG/RHH family protein